MILMFVVGIEYNNILNLHSQMPVSFFLLPNHGFHGMSESISDGLIQSQFGAASAQLICSPTLRRIVAIPVNEGLPSTQSFLGL